MGRWSLLSVKSPCLAAIEVLGSSPTWQRKKEKEKVKNKNHRQQEPWRKLWKESPCLEVRTSRSTHFMLCWLDEFSLLKQWQLLALSRPPEEWASGFLGLLGKVEKPLHHSSALALRHRSTHSHCVCWITHTHTTQIQNLQSRRTILRNTVQAKKGRTMRPD